MNGKLFRSSNMSKVKEVTKHLGDCVSTYDPFSKIQKEDLTMNYNSYVNLLWNAGASREICDGIKEVPIDKALTSIEVLKIILSYEGNELASIMSIDELDLATIMSLRLFHDEKFQILMESDLHRLIPRIEYVFVLSILISLLNYELETRLPGCHTLTFYKYVMILEKKGRKEHKRIRSNSV
jgi:hypothetical protein